LVGRKEAGDRNPMEGVGGMKESRAIAAERMVKEVH
jgi:hypothetical protein